MTERIERDFKGHLVVADDCHWFRTTDVGDYRVSSIGDYRPNLSPSFTPAMQRVAKEIGLGRTYETMVFRLSDEVHTCDVVDCKANGVRVVNEWSELDADGYTSKRAAAKGHEAMVAKWEAL